MSRNIEDYNMFVQEVADKSPELDQLGLVWRAVASTRGEDARDNTETSPLVSVGVPIYRVDGVLFAEDNENLWGFFDENGDQIDSAHVLSTLDVDEFGSKILQKTDVEGLAVWVHTGTLEDGTSARTSSLGPPRVTVTPAAAINSYFNAGFHGGSELKLHSFAMSSIITVPEPNGYARLLLGVICLLRQRGSRGRS